MKVAFVFMAMPVGGAEDFAISVSSQPRFEGRTDFHFLCLRELGVLGEEFLNEGGKVLNLSIARSKRFALTGPFRLAKWLRENQIDLLHSQTYHAHTYSVAAARLAGIPVILHQQKTLEKMKWHRALTLGALMRGAEGVIALSERTAADIHHVLGVARERIFVLPNLVDGRFFAPVTFEQRRELRRQLGLPEKRFLIGTVASLHTVKNHPATLAVARGLHAEGIDFDIRIFGEGRERSGLQATIDRNALSDRVHLVGNRRPIHPWVQALDLFVLPSHWEGQSLALLQAVASGIPVIASSIEGNVAVLGMDHRGLFTPTDETNYLRLVRRAAESVEFRNSLIEAQSAIALPYADGVAEQLDGIYSTVRERFETK